MFFQLLLYSIQNGWGLFFRCCFDLKTDWIWVKGCRVCLGVVCLLKIVVVTKCVVFNLFILKYYLYVYCLSHFWLNIDLQSGQFVVYKLVVQAIFHFLLFLNYCRDFRCCLAFFFPFFFNFYYFILWLCVFYNILLFHSLKFLCQFRWIFPNCVVFYK